MIDLFKPKPKESTTNAGSEETAASAGESDAPLPVTRMVGISVLYASAYFLPLFIPRGAYFLPATDAGRVTTSIVLAVAIETAVILLLYLAARRWCPPRLRLVLGICATAFIAVLAAKGVINVGGTEWYHLLPHAWENSALARRALKFLAVAIALLLVASTRRALASWTRALSSLGFAFAALMAVRVVLLWNAPAEVPPLTSEQAASAAAGIMAGSVAPAAPSGQAAPVTGASGDGTKSRRVIWVLFDETDLGGFPTRGYVAPVQLGNFQRLARASVYAPNANTPASSTAYSIPALLAGVPIGGDGLTIDYLGHLSLRRTDGSLLPFTEAHTLFGALAASGRGASVLGFYHPYCKLFRLSRCDSFPFPEVGGLRSALLTDMPDFLWEKGHARAYWASITRRSLQLLPEYIARDDALTLIHLNVPHLPAAYADGAMHLKPGAESLSEYARNLTFADSVLGNIVRGVTQQSARHELLLVVSTDHWFRQQWFPDPQPEASRPVPLFVWRVGDAAGSAVSVPVSTVHTAAMILDYLDGKLGTQGEIAAWWREQPVSAAFIAPIG